MTKNSIKPTYYDGFACIAGECSFTCCQEWKIAVDEDTLGKWKKLGIDKQVVEKDGYCVVGLDEAHRCPFLNDKKLCKLVIEHGDSILSKTCASFPRQVHEFANRTEYSVVCCCPVVVDLLKRENEVRFISENGAKSEKDALWELRDNMIALVQREDVSLSKSLLMIFFDLLQQLDGEQSDLEALSKAIDEMPFDYGETLDEVDELFLDLIQNYRKEGLYTKHIEEIAKLAEQLENQGKTEEVQEKWNRFFVQWESFQPLIKNCLVSDLFNNVLLPESDLEDMIVMVQWIGMEYSVMRHAIFLRWVQEGEGELTYEMVRDYIVVLSRITGYEQDDIYEYLEASFQSVLWEWGYFALVVNK